MVGKDIRNQVWQLSVQGCHCPRSPQIFCPRAFVLEVVTLSLYDFILYSLRCVLCNKNCSPVFCHYYWFVLLFVCLILLKCISCLIENMVILFSQFCSVFGISKFMVMPHSIKFYLKLFGIKSYLSYFALDINWAPPGLVC